MAFDSVANDYALVLKYIHCFLCLKCLHVNLAERSKFTNGEIQTFMSVDADRTVNLCNSFHDMWRYSHFNLNLLMPIHFTYIFSLNICTLTDKSIVKDPYFVLL